MSHASRVAEALAVKEADDFAGEQFAPPATAAKFVIDAQLDIELRDRIRARMESHKLAQADIARDARVSASMLNKWLLKKPEGDWPKLEEVLDRWDEEFDMRVDLRRANQPTAITRWVCQMTTRVMRTKDFGVLIGPAGIGKSCGFELFRADNPRAILIVAGEQHGSAKAMINDLWNQAHIRRRKRRDRYKDRGDILIERFNGSAAPILIDEFDKLRPSGLHWWKTFHDKTGCPIMGAGNPAGLEHVRDLEDADQATSRIGMCARAEDMFYFDPKTGKCAAYDELADLVLRQFAPAFADELSIEARKVCGRRGHARRLKKQLRLMLDLLDAGQVTDAKTAFKQAATQLLTLE